jgi:Tol biopolymer transport system component
MRALRPTLLALLLALVLAPAASAWPGLNGRVGLTQKPLTKDLWAFGLDGTGTQLTFTRAAEQQLSWAPDGKRIAYKRSDEVFLHDVTTDAPPLRLTEKAVSTENNTQPAWSPDGASIIFRTNRATPTVNVADIWIMDADGENERPLLVRDGDERYPSFSPDGTRLAFVGRSEGGTADIWIANADGSDARMVHDSGREDSAPAWSPDGRRLAFETNTLPGGFDGELSVLDLATGAVTRLTDDPPEAPVHDEGAAWSPDGRMIAFTSERSDPNGDVWIMRSDGSEPRQLTTTSVLDESPDWQPIPYTPVAGRHAAEPCGDLSLRPGGVSSVVTAGVPCGRARRVAERWWSPDDTKARGFRCRRTPHSFDQELVECVHRWGAAKGFGFVWRRP